MGADATVRTSALCSPKARHLTCQKAHSVRPLRHPLSGRRPNAFQKTDARIQSLTSVAQTCLYRFLDRRAQNECVALCTALRERRSAHAHAYVLRAASRVNFICSATSRLVVIGSARSSSPAHARTHSRAAEVLARRHRQDGEVKRLRDGSLHYKRLPPLFRLHARRLEPCDRYRAPPLRAGRRFLSFCIGQPNVQTPTQTLSLCIAERGCYALQNICVTFCLNVVFSLSVLKLQSDQFGMLFHLPQGSGARRLWTGS
jgi:hypothetical protein